MNVSIVGAGNVGSALARAVRGAGHEVTVADVSEDDLRPLAEELGVRTTTSNEEAVRGADAVVLALPFGTAQDVARELAEELADTIVIDVANPMNEDATGLAIEGTSSAELTQEAAPGARVVKAFNTVFAANQPDPEVDGVQLDGFVAADDADAKKWVTELLAEIGYRPIDAGPLSAARYLEAMGLLNISLNAMNEWPWRTGWKLVGPTG